MSPNLKVLPVKASQDAKVKRKLVYLDQMILTSIAKAKLGRRLPPELLEPTNRLRDALKVAVRDRQSAVLVESHFHRDESSGIVTGRPRDPEAQALFDEIARFVTYYSFGLQISPGTELMEIQAVEIVARELGLDTLDRRYRWRIVLSRNPQESNEKNAMKIGDALVVMGIEWRPRIAEDRPWADHVTKMTAVTVRGWIRAGLLPADVVGGRYLIDEDDLESLLAELEAVEDEDEDEDEDGDEDDDDQDELEDGKDCDDGDDGDDDGDGDGDDDAGDDDHDDRRRRR